MFFCTLQVFRVFSGSLNYANCFLLVGLKWLQLCIFVSLKKSLSTILRCVSSMVPRAIWSEGQVVWCRMNQQLNKTYSTRWAPTSYYSILKGAGPRGRDNWGTLRIPREDWGTLGNIREY